MTLKFSFHPFIYNTADGRCLEDSGEYSDEGKGKTAKIMEAFLPSAAHLVGLYICSKEEPPFGQLYKLVKIWSLP